MFTGVGGFELGIGDKGECIGFSEIDKYANELLAKRFPNITNFGDCTKIEADKLPEFDMLCGGFPCQSFSIAGKRRGFQDTRGTMFFEVARIIKAKRPKIVFLENVKGLLNHDKGETFKVIIQTLSELGYDVQWMVLNSKFHGVPQNRERVFIIGNIRGTSRPEILPFTTDDQQLTEKDLEKTYNSGTITARYWKMGQSDQYISYARKHKSQHSRVYNSEGIAPTLAGASKLSGDCTPKIIASRGRNPNNPSDRTTGSPTEQRLEINSEGISNNLTSVQKDNLVLEDMRIRRLTNIECERLQGFPDNWTEGFSGTQRYKMMGNAVTVNVIQAIANKLLVGSQNGN
jgi:DNA (cytosine-5)-methyltransferase 1